MNRTPWCRYLLLVASIIVLDQLAKWWALQLPAEGIQIMPMLVLSTTYNSGISWGIFHHDQQGTSLGVFLLIVAAIGLLLSYTYRRSVQRYLIVPELMIIAGAFSNLLDRLVHGAVIDFIRFQWHEWAFPYFNGADIAIVGGIAAMIGYTLLVERHRELA